MGRGSQSAPSAPSYKSSVVKDGTNTVSTTYQDPTTGSIVTQYIPDAAQAAGQSEAEQGINQIIPTLGQTSPEMAKEYDQAAQAYSDAAMQQFNNSYVPQLTNLRENIASRFGTLNSSQFLSGLNSLQQTQANALAGIAEKAQTIKSQLATQTENNQINAMHALGGVLSADQTALNDNAKTSLNASQSLNDFLNSQWMKQLSAYTSSQNSQRQLLGTMINAIGKVIGGSGGSNGGGSSNGSSSDAEMAAMAE